MEEAPETKSKRFGRVLGKELQGFARLVRPSESSQGSRELGAVGKKYEETTGRDARYDGKVAAIVGLTTAGVVGAGLLIAAASHVVVTGLILAAGTAGVAGCCKLTGHDEEYNQIVNASTTAVHTVVKSTKDFAGGVMEGVHNAPNAAPQGPEGYTRVDSNEAAGPSGNAAAGANNATPPPAAYPTSADGPSPLPPYVNVATPGNTAPLYPPVYAPAPPAAGAKHDLIDLNDSPPKP